MSRISISFILKSTVTLALKNFDEQLKQNVEHKVYKEEISPNLKLDEICRGYGTKPKILHPTLIKHNGILILKSKARNGRIIPDYSPNFHNYYGQVNR